MIKTNSLKQDVSVIDAFRVLVIVSDFELRISDFLNENLVFVQALTMIFQINIGIRICKVIRERRERFSKIAPASRPLQFLP